MADMHVLTSGHGEWRVVMHFAVPDANNAVTVNYRAALVSSGLGGTTALTEGTGPGEIPTAEKGQVESGAMYEHSASFRVESGGTSNAQLQAALREFYTQEKDHIIARLQRQLRYFGHTESEV